MRISSYFYSCPICSESFSLITHCRSHISKHHEQISRTCHTCRETFGSERVLRLHRIRSHRQIVPSERVLTCYICPRFFKHKNSVYKHIVLNHRGSNDTTLAACPTCPQVCYVPLSHMTPLTIMKFLTMCTSTLFLKVNHNI